VFEGVAGNDVCSFIFGRETRSLLFTNRTTDCTDVVAVVEVEAGDEDTSLGLVARESFGLCDSCTSVPGALTGVAENGSLTLIFGFVDTVGVAELVVVVVREVDNDGELVSSRLGMDNLITLIGFDVSETTLSLSSASVRFRFLFVLVTFVATFGVEGGDDFDLAPFFVVVSSLLNLRPEGSAEREEDVVGGRVGSFGRGSSLN
jgi:hypothetical protein